MLPDKLTILNWKILKFGFYFLPIACIVLLGLTSCNTSRCVMCKSSRETIYNVELNEEYAKKLNKPVIQSFIRPSKMAIKNKKEVFGIVDCSDLPPDEKMNAGKSRRYIKKHFYELDSSQVKMITTISDADISLINDKIVKISQPPCPDCNRKRSPFKIELRGMAGVRPLTEKSIFYPSITNGTTYQRKFLGFGIGGTTVVVGPEIALLPRLFTVKNKHSFNLGVLSGFWPVDGGSYIPISLHPRYTLNEFPSLLNACSCNTLYFFGDLGTAYDASGKIDFIYNKKLTSTFFGAGLGMDFGLTKWFDLSVDAGYRYTNLSLPEIPDLKDCIDKFQGKVPLNSIYPMRSVGAFFVRFGITF
jgi:hypothetical protein